MSKENFTLQNVILKNREERGWSQQELADRAGLSRAGFVQARVSVGLVCEEESLEFLALRQRAYDLCVPESSFEDPRFLALVEVVRFSSYPKMLAELPGYDGRNMGEVESHRKN